MGEHKRRIKTITAVVITGICLLSFPTAAQQSGPQSKQPTLSDDDFMTLSQRIKELKNPVFRAFLRTRLLSFEGHEGSQERRHAAMEVATQGVTDLCEHQDEVWSPTASWLRATFVKRIQALQSPAESALEICVLKTDTESSPAKDFSASIKMLSTPETSAAGLRSAKSAILNGQVPADAILAHLVHLQVKQSPHLAELLSAVLGIEERQPGTLPLRLMPFFTPMFLEKSNPPEIVKRFVAVAVRASQRPAEEFANPIVRSSVYGLLNSVVMVAARVAPDLYPEIASRLSFMNKNNPNRTDVRLAAEERIEKASDQLEQLISEANTASDVEMKTHFFFRAARMAKDQGQFSKAVDLAIKSANDRENEGTTATWINELMLEIVSLAVKKETPRDAIYAISKMTRPLPKAKAFRILGEYYGASQNNVKSNEAFTQSAKHLDLVDNGNEKVRSWLSLAESVLKYEPVDAFEVFRQSVKAINNLPLPKKDEKMYYEHLLPIAEDLIRSFRLLSIHENQTATTLTDEIKLSELRVAALTGASLF